jgi:hypothetical protein
MRDDPFIEPCIVDLDDQQAIILHLRALLDLHDLLLNGYDAELRTFVYALSTHGWGKKQIAEFIQLSSYFTRYEFLIDSPIPEVGDRTEYKANRHRWRR